MRTWLGLSFWDDQGDLPPPQSPSSSSHLQSRSRHVSCKLFTKSGNWNRTPWGHCSVHHVPPPPGKKLTASKQSPQSPDIYGKASSGMREIKTNRRRRTLGGHGDDTEKKEKQLCSSSLGVKTNAHGSPRWRSGKESAGQFRRHVFDPWVRRIPWRREWQPTPVFLPGESHGQRSLGGHGPWSYKRVRRG